MRWMTALGLGAWMLAGTGLATAQQPRTEQEGAQPRVQRAQPETQRQGQAQPRRGQAEREGQQQRGQRGQTEQVDAQRFIQEWDKNKDGFVDREELPERLKEQFGRLDRDGDSKLSKEELQAHATRQMQQGRQQRPGATEVVLILVETAGDDEVTHRELQQAYGFLRQLDKDNDGQLTREEVAAGREMAGEHRLNAMIQEMDRNKDGQISREEAQGVLGRQFQRFDRNSDGNLDRQELQQAASQMRRGQQGGPQRDRNQTAEDPSAPVQR